MRKNLALAKQRDGEVTIGLGIGYASLDLAEAAHMGFDLIWLDGQHGEWTEPTLNNALHYAESDLEFRGEYIMNDVRAREALETHVASVARIPG